jgi:hypothetical protein
MNNSSINFLWLNKNHNIKKQGIFTQQDSAKILDVSTKWATLNPESKIYVWFDSLKETTANLKNTFDLFKKNNLSNKSNVELKDIREIPVVKANKYVFVEDMLFYFKVDLLKLITSLYSMKDLKHDHVVFADIFSFKPADSKKLFQSNILKQLDSVGFLNYRFENQFIQMKNSQELIESLAFTINLNLYRLETTLNALSADQSHKTMQHSAKLIHESIYKDTMNFVSKLYQCKKLQGFIEVDEEHLGFKDPDIVEYNYDKHGFKPFGNFYNPRVSTIQYRNDKAEETGTDKIYEMYITLDGKKTLLHKVLKTVKNSECEHITKLRGGFMGHEDVLPSVDFLNFKHFNTEYILAENKLKAHIFETDDLYDISFTFSSNNNEVPDEMKVSGENPDPDTLDF